MEKGHYGVAGKMAELRGKLFGLYIEKHMTLETKLDEKEMKDKLLTYLLAKMYSPKEQADNIASVIATSTFISVVTIPFIVFIALTAFG